MTQIILIRHAAYRDGPEHDGGPHRDLGLSDEGRAQAERLRARLAARNEFAADVFLSSSERRAMETAAILAPALGLPSTPDRDLEEWCSDDGSIPTDVFMAQWRALGERQRPFHRFLPHCETGIEFSTRVHSALHRLASEHSGKRIVLMTHGGVIQVAFQFFFGFGDAAFRRAYPAAGHTSLTAWRREVPPGRNERWVLEFSNDCGHLR